MKYFRGSSFNIIHRNAPVTVMSLCKYFDTTIIPVLSEINVLGIFSSNMYTCVFMHTIILIESVVSVFG